MKKIDSFVKMVIAAGLGCIAFFAGCAGFTEDTNSSLPASFVDDGVGADFTSARVMQLGKISVDDSKGLLTLVLETFGGCLKREGSFFYDANYYFGDETTFEYRFRNDTLLLSYYDEDEIGKDSITLLLSGGTSGKLDGIWHVSPCSYENGKYGCVYDAYEKYFKFDEGSVEYRIGERAGYDYMKSVFVEDLFAFVSKRSSDPQPKNVFYMSRAEQLDDKYGISIREKTNRSMKFVYDDRVFDLNLDYARYMDSVSVRLSSEGVTCIGQYHEISDISPGMCREEFAPYLRNAGSEALKYEKQNDTEFKACIDGILDRKKD